MTKKNLILGGILIILIGVAYIYNGPFKSWQANQGKPKNFLSGINTEKITKIEITKQGVTTALVKTGSKWKIDKTKDFYAKNDNVSAAITQIKAAGKAGIEVVSENKNNQANFNADQKYGTEIKLYVDDKVASDFIVGKQGSDYMSSYVSEPSNNKTYYLKVDLSTAFGFDDWRDTAIFTFDKTKVVKIRFQYPDRQFIIQKKGDKWSGTSPKPFSVSAGKIDPIVNLLSSLTASKIPAQNFSGTGLDKSKIIIQITDDGIDNTLMVGNESAKDKGMFFIKKGDSDNIYLITKDQKNSLDKQIESFK
jgi:hypothetical protein